MKLYVLRTKQNLLDKYSTLYLKAIEKEAKKRRIAVNVIEISSQEELDTHCRMNGLSTIVMEPCEFKIPEWFVHASHNLEKHCTAKVVRKICNELLPNKGTVLIINRSNLIGKPLSHMLLDDDFTVMVAHSKSENIYQLSQEADVIVTATGNKLAYNLYDKRVIDVSDDFKYLSSMCSEYVGMREIGKRTVEVMLEGVKKDA